MPANFSPLRLSYNFGDDDNTVLNFSLHSLSFDINQATIGPNTPFTAEISGELKLESSRSIGSFQKLSEVLKRTSLYPDPDVLPGDPSNPNDSTQYLPQGKTVNEKTMSLFSTYIFGTPTLDIPSQGPWTENRIAISYGNIGVGNTATLFTSTYTQVLISPIQDEAQKLFDWSWAIKLKFHSEFKGQNSGSIVLFPKLLILSERTSDNNPPEGIPPATITDQTITVDPFNDELRLNYEVLYQETTSFGTSPTQGFADTIGKVSDEITDSIAGLTNTLNNNLSSTFTTRLQPAGSELTYDVALWVLILKGTEALSFKHFDEYMNAIFCSKDHTSALEEHPTVRRLAHTRSLPFMSIDAYRCVKIAAEAFVMVNCMVDGIFTEEDAARLRKSVPLIDGKVDTTALSTWWSKYQEEISYPSFEEELDGVSGSSLLTIPYLAVIRSKLKDQDIKLTPFDTAFRQYLDPKLEPTTNTCFGLLSEKLRYPCYLELIWSYWQEESMMVQGLNAISRRFQNVKGPGRDPFAHIELDPLRPLNNLLWGYIQDEQHRLTVRRRAFEYDHHYGIRMHGTVTKNMQFADSRSKFIEAFHRLLNLVSRFYNQADDMTVNPDAYPVLNGLKEVHMILSEGAHNQYGDLPSTARAEMLMQQWLLGRPEFRQFLSGRTMVAYPEDWMEPVATINSMMGWTKTSPLHFRNLARFGEQLLLSIRFGNWADITDRKAAGNWSYFWREQIQGYIHAYRAVTNVDLSLETSKIDIRQPSYHLVKQLKAQKTQTRRGAR